MPGQQFGLLDEPRGIVLQQQPALGGPLYLGTIAGTTIILILATNTAFADFPRLSAVIASDSFMPRQFAYRGSRLVFSYGIVALTVLASLLIVAFRASVTALIPLWAVGVFLSFTLSQAGMARHWWKARLDRSGIGNRQAQPGWRWKLVINGLGAVCTAVVTLVFATTKFRDGAWIILLLLPTLVVGFYGVHHHYQTLAQDLSLDDFGRPPRPKRNRVVMPVSGIHRGTLEALDYARRISPDVTAVHISIDAAQTEKVRRAWDAWGDGVRLVIIESQYRAFYEPFLEYVDSLCAQSQGNERVTIVVPQFVPRRWWHNFMHAQTAFWLRFALLFRKSVVITEVPYQVD